MPTDWHSDASCLKSVGELPACFASYARFASRTIPSRAFSFCTRPPSRALPLLYPETTRGTSRVSTLNPGHTLLAACAAVSGVTPACCFALLFTIYIFFPLKLISLALCSSYKLLCSS
ncbi:UNVERIFIED_CONTAM: hypothetical protein K2H54_071900 [Gekko kuhli]